MRWFLVMQVACGRGKGKWEEENHCKAFVYNLQDFLYSQWERSTDRFLCSCHIFATGLFLLRNGLIHQVFWECMWSGVSKSPIVIKKQWKFLSPMCWFLFRAARRFLHLLPSFKPNSSSKTRHKQVPGEGWQFQRWRFESQQGLK